MILDTKCKKTQQQYKKNPYTLKDARSVSLYP